MIRHSNKRRFDVREDLLAQSAPRSGKKIIGLSSSTICFPFEKRGLSISIVGQDAGFK
jgi:hypothetical protein